MRVMDHTDALLGSFIGLLGGATATVAPPDGVPPWLGYVFTAVLAIAPLIIKRFMAGGAAGDRVRESQLRQKANAKRADGKAALALVGATQQTIDAGNKLLAEADAIDAQADGYAVKAAEKEAANKA